ncbi:gamma-D-glutamyl-L-lysine endopeptidase [mine drainage metagenome]|uniref:Gamma-D-glutamyl-L-lysine endopeptidase n=1 Tax=mine drainage metagenome TaxID=410659 RepID=A0A1J5SAT5_9ZZZZ
MVSELLLGEYAEVVESTKDFIRIKCLYDGYEGWCQRVQLTEVNNIHSTNLFLHKAIGIAKLNGRDCHISLGTPLYSTNEIISFGKFAVQYPSRYTCDATNNEFNSENIQHIAEQFLNAPYLWGGKSVFGIDCSGFTQQVFKLFDIKLPRDAYQQAEMGDIIGFLQETKCGDLAFFDNEEGKITHVGILINSETIIHASGKVRIDKIDNAGIISSDTGERTHRLRIIKRYK